ncbi:MAG: class IIb bacteriocin, lactobin A/cerein 7B family [Bacilli bacterium]
MLELTKKELQNISGGEFNIGIAALIGSIIVFISGIFDGYVRPFSCRKGS